MKLSIIIPMYNAENYISRTLESVKPLLGKQVECVLVDDFSIDSTKDICKAYLSENVCFVDNQYGKGVSGARNTGISKARGDYITFLDSDDVLSANYVAIVNAITKTESTFDVLLYGYEIMDIHDTIKGKVLPEFEGLYSSEAIVKSRFEDLYKRWIINPCWNKAYRKEYVDRHGIRYSEKYSMGEDLNFVLQCMEYMPTFYVLNQIGYSYLQHEGIRLTGRYHADKLEMQTENYSRLQSIYEQCGLDVPDTISKQFYDDLQSFLDDTYYISGNHLATSKSILKKILNNDIQMSVIQTIEYDDWKLPFLKKNDLQGLHRRMALRKWKGKLSTWIRGKAKRKE